MIPSRRHPILESTLATKRGGQRVFVGEPLEFPDDPNSTRARARRHFLNLAIERKPDFARTLLEWRDAKRWARRWHLDGGEAEAQFIEWAEAVLNEDFEREQTRKQWLASADAEGALQLSALGTVYPPAELDQSNLEWIPHVGPPVRASRGRRTVAMDRDIAAAQMALDRLNKSKPPKTAAGQAKRQARIDAAQAALTKAEVSARDAQSEPRFTPRGLDGSPLIVDPWRPDHKPRRQYEDYIKEYIETVECQARAAGMKPGLSVTELKHYEWLVRFQIEGQSPAEIAGKYEPLARLPRTNMLSTHTARAERDKAKLRKDSPENIRRRERNTIIAGIKALAEAIGLKRRLDRTTNKPR